MKDAGNDAKFQESFDFTFSVADYEKNLEMTIEVVNLNDSGSRKAVIGRTSKTISEIIGSLDKAVPITLELLHGATGKEQKKGFIQFNGILSVFEEKKVEDKKKEDKKEEVKSKKPGPSPRAPSLMKDKAAQLSLNISAIEVHELANTGIMFDGQDPAVEIAINKQLSKTKR
jgi:hypothetical protein